MAKYKIVPKEVIKNIIEFLDEVQLEASKGQSVDDLHKINFINWAIGELMNSIDGYDSREAGDSKIKDNMKKNDIIDDYFIDWELPEDMSDEEFEKMVSQFDAFLRGWEKEYKKNNPKSKVTKRKPRPNDIVQHMSLDEVKEYLLDDNELTKEEKFELYYQEHQRVQTEKQRVKDARGAKSLDQILKELNIKPPSSPKS